MQTKDRRHWGAEPTNKLLIMKKVLFTLALALGLGSTAVAQGPLRLRAEVGANVSDFTFKAAEQAVTTPNKLGMRANLGLEFRLMQSGLYLYGSAGYRNSGAGLGKDAINLGDASIKSESSLQIHYATLGAGLGFRFGLGGVAALSIEGGVVGGYAIKGEQVTKLGDITNTVELFKEGNRFKRPQGAVTGAVALEFSRLYLRGGVEYGLTNDLDTEGALLKALKANNRNLYISFGFYL